MKFLHLSDARLGDFAGSSYGWEENRGMEIKENLAQLFLRAQDEGVELVLITGGLFDHMPVTAELKKANDIFSSHPGIEVVIIAGGTDALVASSPARSFVWSENVHFVLTKEVERIVLSRINTEVYAASEVNGETAGPVEFCRKAGEKAESEAIKIAMIRESTKHEPDYAVFKDSEFAYVAVGGPRRYREITKDLIYASGSLEPEGTNDRGEHGLIRAEISLMSGRLENISFEEMAAGLFVTLNVKINSHATTTEIIQSIEGEMSRRGKNNIYSLNISGMRNPDVKIDLGSLGQKYRILQISDTSEPDYDYVKLFKDHPQDMIGFYISRIAKGRDEMSPVEKRAMFYGIDALISTSLPEAKDRREMT